MTMFFTKNLHAEGWWDHMPPGHRVNPIMNAAQLPSSDDAIAPQPTSRASTRPANVFVSEPIVQADPTVRLLPRRVKRSHASAWILVAAVTATGGALAVAALRDPQGMRQHLDATLAEVKDMTGSPSASTTVTAQANAPEATPAPAPAPALVQEAAPVVDPAPVAEPAPAAARKPIVSAQTRSSDAPLPPIAPAAGRSTGDTLPASPIKRLEPLAEIAPKELAAPQPVLPSLPPPATLAPIQPLVVQTPPPVVPPLTVQQSDEVAPPPVQAPASAAGATPG